MAGEKILIVDDQKDFVITLKYFFETKGYKVITAYNGMDALKKAKEIPDMILLDISMPDMNGFDVLQRLRMDPITWQTPIIMLTASADMKSIREALGLRATDYLFKTESLDRILAIVRKYIALYKVHLDFLNQNNVPRKSGIEVLKDINWGRHICAFYSSKEDLLGMLIPYYKAGLHNNELCLWTLSEGLRVKDAKAALSKEIENLSVYFERGQMKIVDDKEVYEDSPGLDQEKVINFWGEEEKNALAQGFDGIRVSESGNSAWGPRWQAHCNYEKRVNDIIGTKKVIAICTYSFYKFSMVEIMDVGTHHSTIIAKQKERFVSFAPMPEENFLEHFDVNGKGIKN